MMRQIKKATKRVGSAAKKASKKIMGQRKAQTPKANLKGNKLSPVPVESTPHATSLTEPTDPSKPTAL